MAKGRGARIVVLSLVEFWNQPVNLRVSYVRICANWRVGELGWCAQDWDAVANVAVNEPLQLVCWKHERVVVTVENTNCKENE